MEPTKSTQPRFLKWTLIIAITIVTNLFVNYAMSLVYKSPVYETFCPTQQVNDVLTKDQCVKQGGQWNANQMYGVPDKTLPAGYCDVNYTCGKAYTDARTAYERNVFITLVLIGVLLIGAAFMVGANSVVKTSLSLSGSLSFLIASMRYWGEAHDWLKVVILGVALVALIILAIKKFSRHDETVRS